MLGRGNLIRLPADLRAVTTINRGGEVDPTATGLPVGAMTRVWRDVERVYRSRTMPAISIAIRHRGQLLLDRAIGHAAGNAPEDGPDSPQTLCTPETPICLFSAAKAVTAMLVHKLAEVGLVRLHDPIAEYIPEFGCRGKQYITIGQVLAHRGGFPTFSGRAVGPELLFDWDACLARICEAWPTAGAGSVQAYHAVTSGFILGEIMRRVTGLELNQVLRERIATPLGARFLSYGLPTRQRQLAAQNAFTGPREPFPLSLQVRRALGGSFADVTALSNDPRFLAATIPAANIYATARELCDFYQCLLSGGAFAGKRLFRRATVARAVTEASQRQFDRTLLLPLRTSEGFMLGDAPLGLYGPRTEQAFGHLGFINIYGWADPARDIAVALLTTGKPLLAGHLLPLIGLLRRINLEFAAPLRERSLRGRGTAVRGAAAAPR